MYENEERGTCRRWDHGFPGQTVGRGGRVGFERDGPVTAGIEIGR